MNTSTIDPARRPAPRSRALGDDGALSICYVSADYPATSPGGIGGIGAHTHALAHAVAALGHDVSVLAESVGGPERFADGRVTVHAIPLGTARMWKLGRWVPVAWLRRSFAVWRALRGLHQEQPLDLVSFPDGYGEGFRYSFSPLTPFVVQLFGPASFVQRWDGRAVPPLRARLESRIERRPAARASLVISATRQFADLVVREWALDPARVRIIRNPLDLERFHPAEAGSRRGGHRILFVGHLQRLKGLLALAAAIPLVAARYHGVEVQLVGNDTNSAPEGGSMRRFLEQMLRERGSLDSVRFLGQVPQEELVPLYQACSVFVLPSLSDVYPNAVLEAMACGRPCVVTDAVGAAELVSESRAGLVVPAGDPDALAGAISRILALPQPERDEMGERARRIVERACATPLIAAQTVEAYREVIRGRAIHAPPVAGENR